MAKEDFMELNVGAWKYGGLHSENKQAGMWVS